MGRRIRMSVPQAPMLFSPSWPYLEEFQIADRDFKKKQKCDFDKHCRVIALPDIPDDTPVWVTLGDQSLRGNITSSANMPRSYIIDVPSGSIRRNCHQLTVIQKKRPMMSRPVIWSNLVESALIHGLERRLGPPRDFI